MAPSCDILAGKKKVSVHYIAIRQTFIMYLISLPIEKPRAKIWDMAGLY